MRRRIAGLFFLLCCLNAGRGEAQTGLSLLKLGVGARAAGFGGAYTAIADDATAVYWNPAGMTAFSGTDVRFIHTQWIQGITHEFIGAVTSNGTSAVGLGFIVVTIDGIEQRTNVPTEKPIGVFDAHDFVLSGSYARVVHESLRLGATIKAVSEKILVDSASGVAFDFGAQYRTPYPGLTVGAAIRNLGPRVSFVQEEFDLPREIRFGVGYVPQYALFRRGVTLSADIGKFRDERLRLSMGGEYTYQGRVSAIVGYQTRRDETGISTGLGIRHRRFRLNYAFVPFGANLGNTHRFALGVRF